MKLLINSEKSSSYPFEMQETIYLYIAKHLSLIQEQIKKTPLRYDSDVCCAIEEYLLPFKAEGLYQKLCRIMIDKEIVCYHATKLYDPNQILKNGLYTNEWNRYSSSMRDTLFKLKVPNIDEVINCIHEEYEQKYSIIDFQPQLCFFSGMHLADSGDIAGYDQYCENIGGELAKRALQDRMPEVFNVLINNGVQVVIMFKLPFWNIADYQKENILYQFVSYYAAKYIWNWDYRVEFDGTTSEDVAPNQILKIIDCTDGRRSNAEWNQ